MIKLFSIIIFLCLTKASFGQNLTTISYGMTAKENDMWLKKADMADKKEKLLLIQNRFFRQQEFKKSETDDVPVIIANGVVVNELTNIQLKNLLATQLTLDKVQITILEKEPEGLYVNKRWTGIIILNITDKKVKKLLKK